jgi:hypothetical protein
VIPQPITKVIISKCFVMWWRTLLPQLPNIGLLTLTMVRKTLLFTWLITIAQLTFSMQLLELNFLYMANHNCPTHIFNATIRVNLFVYKDVFLASIMQVKGQCFVTIDMFIIELEKQFLNFELMNDLKIEYPQFGCNLMPISFSPCILLSLKNTHYEANKIKPHCCRLWNLSMPTT